MSAGLRYRLRLRHNCVLSLGFALRDLAALFAAETVATRLLGVYDQIRPGYVFASIFRGSRAHRSSTPVTCHCRLVLRLPISCGLASMTASPAFGSPPSRQLGKRTSGSCLSPAVRCSWQPQMASTRQQRAILSRAPPSRCKQRRKELLQQVKSSESRGAVSLRVFK